MHAMNETCDHGPPILTIYDNMGQSTNYMAQVGEAGRTKNERGLEGALSLMRSCVPTAAGTNTRFLA